MCFLSVLMVDLEAFGFSPPSTSSALEATRHMNTAVTPTPRQREWSYLGHTGLVLQGFSLGLVFSLSLFHSLVTL